jgi:hypothetical protein
MAVYGLKYTIPFRDIDNLANVVEIYQDGYTGSVTELIATDAPAVHKYEREDNEDLTSSIMSATLSVSFYSTDVTDFRSFYSESDRSFLVQHKFQNNIIFKGYLLNDITGEPFQDPPYPVMLTATDGLAQLKEIALVGPAEDQDLFTVMRNQLNVLDLSLNIEVCNDLYEGLVMDNTKSIFAQSAGENLMLQKGTFDELELNAFDFLLEICKTFGWVLFQGNNKWVIQRAIAQNIDTTVTYLHDYDTGAVISSGVEAGFDVIADQTNIDSTYVPVNSDQLLQYQRPIKKLTLTQGDLGQSIIANGDSFNEDSWSLDGYYRPNDWTINIDPANVPQIFPENIPSQSTWDDEKGVSWDFRFIPSTYTIESNPVFLDNAGLIIDFESQVEFELATGSVAYYFKHVDVNDDVTFLTTEPVIGQEVLTWSSTRTAFGFNSTRANDARTFKMSSFILPAPGFLSVEIHGGTNGATIIKSARLIPTYLGQKNPTEVKKVYETTKGYTTVREDDLVFSDLCIAASKNWLKIGGLPAIVFVEKSLAATPDIIKVPSGAVSQVNKLTDVVLVNTLNFSGGFMDGVYTHQYTAAAGFTIDSVDILKGDLLNTGNTAADLGTVAVVLSSTQVNVVFFDGNSYDTTEQGNAQVTITLKDVNNNTYQVSTFLFQIRESGGGIEQYDIINISFEAQATEGSYSPTLRDCYARNVLTLYNVLSFRFEGSFRRKGNTMGNAILPARLVYSGYTSVRLQVIGWEYDLASRVVRITFGQVPTAYVYPIN